MEVILCCPGVWHSGKVLAQPHSLPLVLAVAPKKNEEEGKEEGEEEDGKGWERED